MLVVKQYNRHFMIMFEEEIKLLDRESKVLHLLPRPKQGQCIHKVILNQSPHIMFLLHTGKSKQDNGFSHTPPILAKHKNHVTASFHQSKKIRDKTWKKKRNKRNLATHGQTSGRHFAIMLQSKLKFFGAINKVISK